MTPFSLKNKREKLVTLLVLLAVNLLAFDTRPTTGNSISAAEEAGEEDEVINYELNVKPNEGHENHNDNHNENHNDSATSKAPRVSRSSPGEVTTSQKSIYAMRCEQWRLDDYVSELNDNCKLLKFFNRTQVELMGLDESIELARYCACQLHFMDPLWAQDFDSDRSTRQLYAMVRGKLEHDHSMAQLEHQRHVGKHFSAHHTSHHLKVKAGQGDQEQEQAAPKVAYLWTDVDVTLYGYSIYVSSRDYFDKLRQRDARFRREPELKSLLDKDPIYKIIRVVCLKVAEDKLLLYQYLENLARLNPVVFLELVNYNQYIEFVYQASKACKLLLLEHFSEYKLRPATPDFVPVAGYPIEFSQQAELMDPAKSQQQAAGEDAAESTVNELTGASNYLASPNDIANAGSTWATSGHGRSDIEGQLRATVGLASPSSIFRCKQHKKLPMAELAKLCPMMFEERISSDWFRQNSLASHRSQQALKCGCQLILHNSTWSTIMQDPNVQRMTKCLIDYLNQDSVPNFVSTPVATLFGWFKEQMLKFSTNRQFTIRQMFASNFEGMDPIRPINHQDDEKSLEILRRGCNLIMFNYNKNSRFTSELKLIKYLDRLQLLSQDHLFVFHLTLLDTNLFKLHALSKMCQPIIS